VLPTSSVPDAAIVRYDVDDRDDGCSDVFLMLFMDMITFLERDDGTKEVTENGSNDR
jgi:hypothetical protein